MADRMRPSRKSKDEEEPEEEEVVVVVDVVAGMPIQDCSNFTLPPSGI